MDRVAVKFEHDLVLMDEGNGEEQVKSNEPIRSRDIMKWIISFGDMVGAYVASTSEEME